MTFTKLTKLNQANVEIKKSGNANKKLYLVLDTETLGIAPKNIVYDIAWRIVDKNGVIYKECAYLVKEIMCNKELMQSAYYAEKIPAYRTLWKQGTRLLKDLQDIKAELLADLKCVDYFTAYNAQFDKGAIEKTFNIKIEKEMYCIWKNSAHIFGTRKGYKEYCKNNGHVSEAGNVKTNAEVMYRYLEEKHSFIEEHMALEDVKIEHVILYHLFRQKKKNYWQSMNWKSGAWQDEK